MDAPPLRLPSLTSLRWVAASAVFLRHAGQDGGISVQGITGVSFFFLLSGFVLAWSHQPATTDRVFYRRRFARVWPAHALTTVLVVPVLFVIQDVTASTLGIAASTLTLLHAWVPVEEWFYGGNGVSWSLSVELFFYACFPFLIRRLARLDERSLRQVCGGLVLVGIGLPVLLHPSAGIVNYWLLYISPAVRIIEFAFGICLALLVRRGGLPVIALHRALVLAAGAYLLAGQAPPWAMFVSVTLVPYAVLIVAAAQRDVAGSTPRVLRAPLAVLLGEISFALYLVHAPILHLGHHWGFDGVAASLAMYLISGAVAYVLYTGFERPVERRLRPARSTVAAG